MAMFRLDFMPQMMLIINSDNRIISFDINAGIIPLQRATETRAGRYENDYADLKRSLDQLEGEQLPSQLDRSPAGPFQLGCNFASCGLYA
jgi:hypothetical protein